MREQQVDWTRGGQFLHLAYAVEQFLSELVSRGALFCIAFFESHTSVWKKNSSIFARALLIKHFKRTLPSTASLAFFDSPYSQEWVNFLTSFQPSLVAVADAPLLCDSAEEERFPLLRFAQVCRRSGVNVLLLRDVEFSENILRGFYVQSQKSGSTRSLWMALAGSTESAGAGVLNGKADVDPFLALPRVKSENFRILASAWACTLWMEGPGASGGASSAMLAKTFMLQAALIQMGCVTLEQRACCVSQNSGERTTEFLEFVFGALSKSAWPLCEKPEARPEDLCDFADGRLFHSILGFVALKGSADASAFGLDSTSSDAAATAWACVEGSPLFPLNMVEADRSLLVLGTGAAVPKDAADFALVAVSGCTLIDDAMKGGVHREVGARESAVQGSMLPEAVQGKGWRLEASLDETFLWTHCRDQSASAAPSSRNMSEWERRRQLRWKARQSQMYFRHLHEYATSLAGTTVLGASSQSAGASVSASADEPQQGDAEGEGNAKGGKKGAGGKKGGKEDKKKPEKKLSKKEQMLADIEAKKQKGVANKLEGDWKELKSALSSSASNVAKIKDLDDFIARCLSAGQMPLALEVTLRKLSECKEGWAEDRQGRGENMKFAIMTFECVRTVLTTHAELIQDPALPAAERARLDVVQTMIQFGFVDAALSIADGLLDKKHQEARKEYDEEVKDMARQFRNKLSVHSKSSAHFQLEHMGHLLPRPPPKVKDPRITSFTPDDWQRSLLDAVDARDCALVCAPTSSGKTFISHYCMDKVMHDTTHKDGVVVFVAPTKALINQIAAQVYGSFHSHFGIYTDAYRHRALTCRILITVPECLESLLMSPSSAVWAQKIRYVILDEIHCISTSEEGKVWEHILLMLHAPFLALSATVGEPEKFVRWLQRIKDLQKQVDGSSRDESYIVKLVQHTERFVDLRRHLYIGQEDWDSKAAASSVRYAKLHNRARVDHTSATVEGAEFLETLHPLVSFTRAQLDLCEIPQNLKFEPKDSLSLVDAMQTVVRRCEAIPLAARVEALETLDPVNYFKGDQTFITKPQAARFEDAVKEELTLWMKEGWKEEVVKVLLLLGNKIVSDQGAQDEDEPGKQTRWMDRLFHLMCVLHRQDRLPAVVFNFDRSACERIAFHFSGILQSAEDSARQEHAKTLSKSKKTLEQVCES